MALSTVTMTVGRGAHEVLAQFQLMYEKLDESRIPEDVVTESADEQLRDSLERFKMWAGSCGAFKSPQDLLSLDCRLKSAPEVADRLRQILSDVLDLLRAGTAL